VASPSAKITYVLETPEGGLPTNIPNQAKVFFMPKPSANLLALDVAKEKAKTPTAQKMGDFENTPGKDKATSYKKEVKADHKDGGDKSASKSPIVAAKK